VTLPTSWPQSSAPRSGAAVERVAVVRALPGLGDLLCAVPALRAVRSAHPGAHVALVGLPAAAWFAARFDDLVDELLVLAGVPGLPEVEPDPAAALHFFAEAQARRFDLALQLHGSGVVTNPVTTMLGAARQVTAHLPGQWRPPGTSIAYPEDAHEVHRLLAVTDAAGCPRPAEEAPMPLTGEDRAGAQALLGARGADRRPYACLHPGASRAGNRWPAERFAAVGDRLVAAGHRVVLTGTEGERDVVGAVSRAMVAPVVDACGQTSVGTLAALFAGAAVVVSNDTGAAHLAAAVRAPSVVVFPSDGDPRRWAPLDRDRHARVGPEPPRVGAPAGAAAPATWPVVGAVLDALARQLASSAPSSAPSATSDAPLQEVR
jgi:ADP-heptose:LPS heptosyltransferase